MSDDYNKENSGKHKNDNIIEFTKHKKQKTTYKKTKENISEQPERQNQPIINLPPVTKYLLGIIVVIHLIITLTLSSETAANIYTSLGFVPARWSGVLPFEATTIITPLSYMLLHGSWLHIAINGIMLMAFGSGVEKWLGGKKMMFIFIFSGLCGIALQYVLNTSSIHPVIGASGGLSGLFAASFIMINKMQRISNPRGIWPFIILWVVISVIFGFIGSPDGNLVAWAAHLGGFLGGFIALKLLKLI